MLDLGLGGKALVQHGLVGGTRTVLGLVWKVQVSLILPNVWGSCGVSERRRYVFLAGNFGFIVTAYERFVK